MTAKSDKFDSLRKNVIDGHLTSEALAGFIADSLIHAKLLEASNIQKAMAVIIEEIDVIKAMNVY